MSADAPTEWIPDQNATLRRSVYLILILIAFGMISGHIVGVERVYQPRLGWPSKPPAAMATHADNDRSRWATIRALVERQNYTIGWRGYYSEDRTKFLDEGQITESGWGTIDKVLNPVPEWKNDNPQPNDILEAKFYYSSKPPLLPTILAGEYWVLNKLFGWKLSDETRWPVVYLYRWMGVPMPEEGRWAVVRIILFTINGLPWLIALLLMARMIEKLGTSDLGRIAAVAAVCYCTFVNAFANTLNNHTIACWSVVFALYPVVMSMLNRQPMGFLAGLASGFWAAWTVTNELPAAAFAGLLGLWILIKQPRAIVPFILGALLPVAGFLLTNYLAIGTIIPAYEKFGTEWYNYQGSFWHPDNIRGIDKPRDSTLVYLFHLTFGHHGLFSLTPILLLALGGLLAPFVGDGSVIQKQCRKLLGWGTLVLSLVILGFYLSKTESYNYGGWTSGPRWFIWLTPLWILGSVPILDALARSRAGRFTIALSLGWSAFSVAFPMYTPWTHPWLYRILEHWQLIDYT